MVAARGFSKLDDWLAWLETLHPKKIDFSLNRIRAVLDALDLRAPQYRVITVGGTNGKGSCVAMLESIYRSAGYAVGAFTSPHLWRFNERIRCDGVDVSDAALIEIFTRVEAARGQVTLSYFEYSAVAAMLCFAIRRVAVAILEVGMGGRLDAVNALDADGAMIVSIDLDHQEWLGPDRDAIGREKAGIMRRGRPVVIADRDPPASLRKAVAELDPMALWIGRDFDFVPIGEREFEVRAAREHPARLPQPRFGGAIQLTNAAACVALVDALQTCLPVDREAVRVGLETARAPARAERRMLDGIEWIFDVAHNPAAASCLRCYLDGLRPASRTLAVVGAMRDKALVQVLAPFAEVVDQWLVAPVDSERGADVAALGAALAALGISAWEAYESIAAACRGARRMAMSGERVLAFGSFYVAGPAMAELEIYSPVLAKG